MFYPSFVLVVPLFFDANTVCPCLTPLVDPCRRVWDCSSPSFSPILCRVLLLPIHMPKGVFFRGALSLGPQGYGHQQSGIGSPQTSGSVRRVQNPEFCQRSAYLYLRVRTVRGFGRTSPNLTWRFGLEPPRLNLPTPPSFPNPRCNARDIFVPYDHRRQCPSPCHNPHRHTVCASRQPFQNPKTPPGAVSHNV